MNHKHIARTMAKQTLLNIDYMCFPDHMGQEDIDIIMSEIRNIANKITKSNKIPFDASDYKEQE